MVYSEGTFMLLMITYFAPAVLIYFDQHHFRLDDHKNRV